MLNCYRSQYIDIFECKIYTYTYIELALYCVVY